jgi:hypothetical protein
MDFGVINFITKLHFVGVCTELKHILCSTIFFCESHAAYVITWKTVIQPERPEMII